MWGGEGGGVESGQMFRLRSGKNGSSWKLFQSKLLHYIDSMFPLCGCLFWKFFGIKVKILCQSRQFANRQIDILAI